MKIFRKKSRILSAALALVLVFALLPVGALAASDVSSTGRLLDYPVVGNIAAYQEIISFYEAHVGDAQAVYDWLQDNVTRLGLSPLSLPTDAADIEQWLNSLGYIRSNSVTDIYDLDAAHNHITLDGVGTNTATVTVGDCDIYDFDVANVIADALGEVSLSATNLGFKVKNGAPPALTLTGADIAEIMEGVRLTMGGSLEFSIPATFSGRISVSTPAVPPIPSFSASATVVISGELTLSVPAFEIGYDFSSGAVINLTGATLLWKTDSVSLTDRQYSTTNAGSITILNGLLDVLLSNVFSPSNVDSLVNGLLDISVLDSIIQDLKDLLNNALLTFELKLPLSDIASALNSLLPANSASAKFDLPYSFGYGYTGLQNGTYAMIPLDDVVSGSWLKNIKQGPYTRELYLGDTLRELFPNGLDIPGISDFWDTNVVAFLLGGSAAAIANILNLDIDQIDSYLSGYVQDLITGYMTGQLSGLLSDVLSGALAGLSGLGITGLTVDIGTPVIDLNIDPFIKDNLKVLIPKIGGILDGTAGKLTGWAKILVDNIGITGTFESNFDSGVITNVLLSNVTMTEKAYSFTASASPSSILVGASTTVTHTDLKTADNYTPVNTVTYSYSSSDTSVATVSSTGVVTGVAPGTAIITVTATFTCIDEHGDTVTVTETAEVTITVTDLPPSPPPGGGGGGYPDGPIVTPTPGGHKSYINGYEDGTVRPDGYITRAEAAMIFFRLLEASGQSYVKTFPDVTSGAWYYQAVGVLAARGILNGYDDGKFYPNAPMTREEFVALVCRFYNKSVSDNGVNPFSDVSVSRWSYGYIVTAYKLGWVVGYDNAGVRTFMPAANITRAEVVTIVNRILERKLLVGNVDLKYDHLYSDLARTHWAFADIIEASIEHSYNVVNDTEIWK